MVLEAAQGSNVQLYVSTFYQEGGSPEFDDGIKAWLNEDSTAMTNNGGNDTIAAVTAMGYDAYYVALEALKAAGSPSPLMYSKPCGTWSMTAFPATSPLIDHQRRRHPRHRLYQDRRHRQQRVEAGDGPDRGIKACHFGQPGGVTPPGGLSYASGGSGTASKGAAARPFWRRSSRPVIFEEKKGESLWNMEFRSCCRASRWADSTH